MVTHIRKDSREGPDAESVVARDRDVMLALLEGRQAQVAAGLAGDGVAENTKCVGEIVPREIPGKPHTAMVSSLTK